MANISSFAINIVLSASVANPIVSTTFQAIAPWGQSNARPNIEDALNEILHRGGSQYSGAFFNYMNAQTLNGASGSGPTAFTTANQL